jgi:hypothetical protein
VSCSTRKIDIASRNVRAFSRRLADAEATLRVERSGLAGRIAKRRRFGMERFR